MKVRLAVVAVLAFAACAMTAWADLVRTSPDGRNEIRAVTRDGVTRLQVFRDGRALTGRGVRVAVAAVRVVGQLRVIGQRADALRLAVVVAHRHQPFSPSS